MPSGSKKVLVLTPWVPYPLTGACQQDRFHGLRQMQSLGYEVSVIAKIHSFQDQAEIERVFATEKIPLKLIPYVRSPLALLMKRLPRLLSSPALVDGAALEYTDPAFEHAVLDAMHTFKPDVVWIEYSLLWPLLKLVAPFNVPTIVKSSLNEPLNCLDEHGHSFLSWLKSLPKYAGERIAAREGDMILAITPKEEEWYRQCGATHTGVLPLRGLAHCFMTHQYPQKEALDVVFLSSNYSMGHNRDALHFLLAEIVPRVRERAAGKFHFHVSGKKFPDELQHLLADDVHATGFIDDIGAFLQTMDIALCPQISGQGMQQKVFEPLCRGLPLLTHHTAGYPFIDGQEVLLAQSADEYARKLFTLESAERRRTIGMAGQAKARSLFSEERVKTIVKQAIESVSARYQQ